MTLYNLPEDLFPYQKEDVQKIASSGNILDFSEMGTGKTPTSLGVSELIDAKLPLIICPNSLRLEWKRQIEDWIGIDRCAISTNDSYTKLKPIIYSLLENHQQKYRIINYETLRNKENVELLNMIPFDLVICDEVHKLRNPKTKLVMGTKNRLIGEMEGGAWNFFNGHPNSKILCLSGSPIMNYPNDLYVPLTLVDPAKYPRTLSDWNGFMRRYCNFSTGRYGTYIYGYRNMESLRKETNQYIIRRTKAEALPYLPEKYYRRVTLSMKPDQRKIYDEMEKDLRITLDSGEPLSSPTVVAQIVRLRQLNLDPKIVGVTCSSAKTDFILDLVEGLGDEKLVIFSTFEKYIFWLSLLFKEKNISHISVTGQVPPNQRIEEVQKFQEDPSIRLALCTIQTGGEGITLTAASNVCLVDRWWNEPTCQQAIDRLHRIGQVSKVQVIYPIVERSIDSALDETLKRKGKASQDYYQEKDVIRMVLESRIRG